MISELEVGNGYDLASRPFRSGHHPHCCPVRPRHVQSLSPQKCCQPKKAAELRVGDSKELYEEVNRKVEPRYRMIMRDLQRKAVTGDSEARFMKFNLGQEQRRLQSEMMRLHKNYEWEMRLHMERPTVHVDCFDSR